ncbi:glucose-6-phosphate dehydrogenase [Microbacterium sp. NPDC076911]|uniref:glucose-6-phosphate dehydrogenase n=1 Tax=Microbacterium sp. NPDC076911 TaxID=3154958 RepID=UPI00341DC43A
MKITTSSDWRDEMPFDVPVSASEVLPGEPTRCAGCGSDASLNPRTVMWAVKHRHPNNHAGFVRLYCSVHVPKPPARAPELSVTKKRERRPAARKADAVPERPKILCPDCYVEVPSHGTCGMCGQQVAG